MQILMKKSGTTQRADTEDLLREGDRLMRVDEVAFKLGISVRSVWRLIASDEFPNCVKLRRCVRLPLSDIQAFVKKNRQGQAAS